MSPHTNQSSRRCAYRTPQVWLRGRGRGLADPDHAHGMLSGLMRGHTFVPNSLLHAAAVRHYAAAPAVLPGGPVRLDRR